MAVMKLLLALALSGLSLAAQTFHGAADLDSAIETAIREDKIPGAVLLIGHEGKVVYRKAYGSRALSPAKEAMTPDTIFDIASLTKVVSTTTCMMKLVEQGKVSIDEPVTTYLPEFQGGKSAITVRDLMTHFSGFRPDLDTEPAEHPLSVVARGHRFNDRGHTFGVEACQQYRRLHLGRCNWERIADGRCVLVAV